MQHDIVSQFVGWRLPQGLQLCAALAQPLRSDQVAGALEADFNFLLLINTSGQHL